MFPLWRPRVTDFRVLIDCMSLLLLLQVGLSHPRDTGLMPNPRSFRKSYLLVSIGRILSFMEVLNIYIYIYNIYIYNYLPAFSRQVPCWDSGSCIDIFGYFPADGPIRQRTLLGEGTPSDHVAQGLRLTYRQLLPASNVGDLMPPPTGVVKGPWSLPDAHWYYPVSLCGSHDLGWLKLSPPRRTSSRFEFCSCHHKLFAAASNTRTDAFQMSLTRSHLLR